MSNTENGKDLHSKGSEENADYVRPDLRHSLSLRSNWWQRVFTSIFPFLIFRHPEHKPLRYLVYIAESIWTAFKTRVPFLRSQVVLPRLFVSAMELTLLLSGSMIAILFIVYICFSFNGADKFPSVGESLYYVLLLRNIILIVLMHFLCFRVARPNFARIRALRNTTSSHMGLFHTIGRWTTIGEYKHRWFTNFLSDSVLLSLTYVFYLFYGLSLVWFDGGVSRGLSEISNMYRGSLTCGFIMYTLEFAPTVRRKSTYNAICMFVICMQIADFFLFVFDKQEQGPIQRALGAGAQLFITHSSVLLAVIIGQHHHHEAQLMSDFPLKSVWKIILVLAVAATWLVYAIFRDIKGHDTDNASHWIPTSYPYVLWAVSVLGGFLCLVGAAKYCFVVSQSESAVHNEPSNHSNHINDEIASFANPANDVHDDKNSHKDNSIHEKDAIDQDEQNAVEEDKKKVSEEKSGQMDFDILLIVITFSLSTLFYSSEVFGALSHKAWWTLLYWVSTPLAPIGLGVFAATLWWKPSNTPRFIIYFALSLSGVLLMSMEAAGDCHLNSAKPACCEYPWLPDTNAEFEHANEKPECNTILFNDQCLAPYTENEPIALSFSAVVDVTQAVNVNVWNGEESVFTTQLTNIDDLVFTTTCQDQVFTTKHSTFQPGCFGGYIYTLPDTVPCDPSLACTVAVSTLNCAFQESEPLLFVVADATHAELDQFSFGFTPIKEKDVVDSTFYSVYKLVGMAALLECFFTLFGVLLKLAFLSECHTLKINHH